MTYNNLIIGTRKSALAVAQSMMLAGHLKKKAPELSVSLNRLQTTGDRILDKTLDKIGGKGLFVKELDHALREGSADLAVHCLKDMPMETPEDLPILCCSRREDPRDVLVLPKGCKEPDPDLPIGTSSLRRKIQLQKLYPGFRIEPVRGNVQTRLRKLDEGQYGALVLAAAGLIRLGLEERISRYFSGEEMIPAAGQGILAVQGRKDEEYLTSGLLDGFADADALAEGRCERAFVRELNGGCSSPVCAHAKVCGEQIVLRGLYYDEETQLVLTGEETGMVCDAEKLGASLACRLRCEAGEQKAPGKRSIMAGEKVYPGKQSFAAGGDEGRKQPGTVFLVGAGPGDPGLFTLRGKEVLQKADVVVYDALAGQGVLSMVPDQAETIYVGKRSGNHTMRQEEISALLCREAEAGKCVVRLKGGDPFLFGRGGEEIELLVEKGIPFEVVPGVTSALAVPAYCGIPVTHRDYCSSLHIITGHRRAGRAAEIDYSALVRTGGTLVFLMGIAALEDIIKGLTEAGMDQDMPAAILENGTTARQRRISGTVGTIVQEAERMQAKTPAIILVGKVCALGDRFRWYENRPLAGKRILVTRPKKRISSLAAMLRDKGAEVVEMPAIDTVPVRETDELEKCVRNLTECGYDWIVFTSPSGVEIFMDFLIRWSDVRALGNVKIAAIGRGTEKELQRYALRADFVPSVYDGRTLGKELAAVCEPGARILIPRAAIGSPELTEQLRAGKDLEITDIATYDTVYTAPRMIDIRREIENGAIDVALFTSASSVRGFAAALGDADYSRVRAVCIGKQTEAAARSAGMQTVTADSATLESLVRCAEQYAGSPG